MRKLLLQSASVVSLILVISFCVYLGNLINSVESIESKLSYQVAQLDHLKPLDAMPTDTINTTYVPSYSHIYVDDGQPVLLAATLTLRNTDKKYPLLINSVEYYDTQGKLVKSYLSNPIKVAPMATAEFLSEKRDIAGGVGANFYVSWSADEASSRPIFEAVMVGEHKGSRISFTSRAN
ncbi:DUF3124 domain-containing protein [Motilimonas eburnea]|uniref:DUF3124 domain-containing protein n=1 Tax=Motilimonas eburnea TaxID=1737488 RepID=UPI001E37E140|nr:DUF3124 domain-containing protein [Motilimonas eburnea]MCE2572031.1 DUF3124 domain-containing protein [Motilimonas eburnea]